jgi:hypothetical protein
MKTPPSAGSVQLQRWLVSEQQSLLDVGTAPGPIMFLVKGTTSSIGKATRVGPLGAGRFTNSLRWRRVDSEGQSRRGWDPSDPWSPDEAFDRARHYWVASAETLELWNRLISRRGGRLALLVPDQAAGGHSVIQFVWDLDTESHWEDFGNKFGFPEGTPVSAHPWIGCRPVDKSGRGFLNSPTTPGVTVDTSGHSEPPGEAPAATGRNAEIHEEAQNGELATSELVEGSVKETRFDSYERNPKARVACLEHYGYSCSVCDFDFEGRYGAIGRAFIHVHHLTPLSQIKAEYVVNPIKDLIPVCPNCHAMLHRPEHEPMTPEELRSHLRP